MQMLAHRSPHEAYRRVEFDARVEGADPQELVRLCYEQIISSLGLALIAHEKGDNQLKSRSLTRALSGLTALQLGIDGDAAIAQALNQLYAAARRSILDCAVAFEPATIATIRQDFVEIGQAMK